MSADFNFVTARLATGALIRGEADLADLIAAGINVVIDCCEPPDPGMATHPQISYLHNPTADDGQPKPAEWFRRSLDWALPCFAMPGKKIFCHCAAGVNRGPSTTFAILRALGLSALEAEVLIIKARPVTVGGLRYKNDASLAVQQLGYA